MNSVREDNRERIIIDEKIDACDSKLNNINFNDKEVYFLYDNIRDVENIVDVVNYISNRFENVNFILDDDADYRDFEAVYDKINKPDCLYVPYVVRISSILSSATNYSLSHIKSVDDFIHNFSSYIKNTDLSNYEKIMAAYNIAVKISPANRGDAEDSRNIYGLFSSGAIVCGGYVDVFNRLLESIGIECKLGSVRVKESRSAHAISVVAIDDDKYDIHGKYFFDPTGDSNLYYSIKKQYKDNTLRRAKLQNKGVDLDSLFSLFLPVKFAGLGLDEFSQYLQNQFFDSLDISQHRIEDSKCLSCLYQVHKEIFHNSMDDSEFILMNKSNFIHRFGNNKDIFFFDGEKTKEEYEEAIENLVRKR